MPDNGNAQDQTTEALPRIYFKVEIGSLGGASFQEISGPDEEGLVIDYRHGNSPIFYPIKMPGLGQVGNVTFKKGIFVKDDSFFDWYNESEINITRRETVVISLLDEAGHPTMKWTLGKAWPTKITAPDMKAVGDEVTVETLELAYESLTIENA